MDYQKFAANKQELSGDWKSPGFEQG
jgi:hypothetical protein